MLNVYFTIQRLHRGLPISSTVVLIKHRELCTRSEAFVKVLDRFGDSVLLGSNQRFRPFVNEFATLLGSASAKDSKGAASLSGDYLLSVTLLEGEACERALNARY